MQHAWGEEKQEGTNPPNTQLQAARRAVQISAHKINDATRTKVQVSNTTRFIRGGRGRRQRRLAADSLPHNCCGGQAPLL